MRNRMSHASVRSAARLSVTAGLAGILLAAGAPVAAFAEPESDLDSARSQLEQIGSEVSDLQDDLAKQTDKLNQTEYEIGEKAYVAVLDMPAVLPFASFDRKYTGIAICLMISYSAVYHMISLLSGSKVRAAVLCILVGFGFLFLSIYIFSELAQPEMIQQYVQTSGGGITEWVKNPAYVDGTKREIYEWLLDVIPTGQAMQVTSSAHRWLRMMACSLGTAVVCSCVGICCFRRRNIK